MCIKKVQKPMRCDTDLVKPVMAAILASSDSRRMPSFRLEDTFVDDVGEKSQREAKQGNNATLTSQSGQ